MNESGMNPCGDRVVVLPEAVESVTAGGIIIPEKEAEKHQLAQVSGMLVAVGPDAWTHSTTITERRMGNGKWRETERKRSGYSGDFAKVGDRVCFARYNGLPFDGEDGKQYRLLNDEDITGKISDTVDFTQFKSREPLGAQG